MSQSSWTPEEAAKQYLSHRVPLKDGWEDAVKWLAEVLKAYHFEKSRRERMDRLAEVGRLVLEHHELIRELRRQASTVVDPHDADPNAGNGNTAMTVDSRDVRTLASVCASLWHALLERLGEEVGAEGGPALPDLQLLEERAKEGVVSIGTDDLLGLVQEVRDQKFRVRMAELDVRRANWKARTGVLSEVARMAREREKYFQDNPENVASAPLCVEMMLFAQRLEALAVSASMGQMPS